MRSLCRTQTSLYSQSDNNSKNFQISDMETSGIDTIHVYMHRTEMTEDGFAHE